MHKTFSSLQSSKTSSTKGISQPFFIPSEIKARLQNKTKTLSIQTQQSKPITISKSNSKLPENENFQQEPQKRIIATFDLKPFLQQRANYQPEITSPYTQGILRITCNALVPNPLSPWTFAGETKKSSTGFAVKIGPNFDEVMVLTNCHAVLEGLQTDHNEIMVELFTHNNQQFKGSVVMMSKVWDLALIKPDAQLASKIAECAVTIPRGTTDMSKLEFPNIGRRVLLIGFPFGDMSQTSTTGTITSVSSQKYALTNFVGITFVTDAAVNPGNSGGPVYTLSADNKLDFLGVMFEGQGNDTNYVIPGFQVSLNVDRYLHLRETRENNGIIHLDRLQSNVSLDNIANENLRQYLDLENGLKKFNLYEQNRPVGLRVRDLENTLDGTELKRDDILVEMAGHKLYSDSSVLINDTPMSYQVLHMALTEQNSQHPIKYLRKTGEEWELKSAVLPCSTPVDLISKSPSDTNTEYATILGSYLVVANPTLVKMDMESNSATVDELNLFLNGRRNPHMSQVLMLRNFLPNEHNEPLQEIPNAVITKINEREVTNISEAIVSLHYPLQIGGKEVVVLRTLEDNLVVLDCKGSFQNLNNSLCSRMGIPSPGYRSTLTAGLLSHCGCTDNNLVFGKSEVNCSLCNHSLATVAFEQGRVNINSVSPNIVKMDPILKEKEEMVETKNPNVKMIIKGVSEQLAAAAA